MRGEKNICLALTFFLFFSMGICWTKFWVLCFLVLLHLVYLTSAQINDYPAASLSTLWIYSPSQKKFSSFEDESIVIPILVSSSIGSQFIGGFFCKGTCNSYLFAILIIDSFCPLEFDSLCVLSCTPQVVWSANRNNPVGINATLQLMSDGDLVLKDVDGSIAWSTNTSGKSPAGLNLTVEGNLVLFGNNNDTVWQSIDHPTEKYVPPATPVGKKTSQMPMVLRYGLASFFGLLLLIGIIVILVWKKGEANEAEEDHLDQVPGMLMRFCYKDLKAMAANFTKLLGEGGFGSVFEGTLNDGTKIAVKRLNGSGQVKKSFVAEVEAIGSIHHVNLVRLLGFCAEKSHRLLVYEYMSNGSLDKWIFHKTSHYFVLDWEQRKKIILDIAKGLAYLHEECRQKIIHLDIKPQNILLDYNLSAKISDFGLSKLIDRDQSKTVTTMRGTPGYMAPEWLSSVITEKVDIYSFGVVVLEILCGRRNFDPSQPEDRRHLVKILVKNEEEDSLLDLVDNHRDDMQVHRAEILNMMRVAVWCLQSDYENRPSMSVVVKVLEGVVEIEHNLDYTLANPPLRRTSTEFSELLPSIVSGPR